jgi:hypothetical protein
MDIEYVPGKVGKEAATTFTTVSGEAPSILITKMH